MDMLVLMIRHWRLVLFALALMVGPVSFKIWLDRHDARILAGYVLLSEKRALEAELETLKARKLASDIAVAGYTKRLATAQASEAQAAAELEQGIASHEKRLADIKRDCAATDDDVDFILRHR